MSISRAKGLKVESRKISDMQMRLFQLRSAARGLNSEIRNKEHEIRQLIILSAFAQNSKT